MSLLQHLIVNLFQLLGALSELGFWDSTLSVSQASPQSPLLVPSRFLDLYFGGMLLSFGDHMPSLSNLTHSWGDTRSSQAVEAPTFILQDLCTRRAVYWEPPF